MLGSILDKKELSLCTIFETPSVSRPVSIPSSIPRHKPAYCGSFRIILGNQRVLCGVFFLSVGTCASPSSSSDPEIDALDISGTSNGSSGKMAFSVDDAA